MKVNPLIFSIRLYKEPWANFPWPKQYINRVSSYQFFLWWQLWNLDGFLWTFWMCHGNWVNVLKAVGRAESQALVMVSWPLVPTSSSSLSPGHVYALHVYRLSLHSHKSDGDTLVGNIKVGGQFSCQKSTENHTEENRIGTCSHSGQTCGVSSNVPSHRNDQGSLATPRGFSRYCLVINPCVSYWVIQFQFPTLRKQREAAILRGSRLQICSIQVFLRICVTRVLCSNEFGKCYKFCGPLG